MGEAYVLDHKILKSIDDSCKTLSHYGMPMRSGRYPWGSGENPFQSLRDWKGYVSGLKKSGMTMEQIAEAHGVSVDELKASMISTSQQRQMTTIKKAQATVENVARVWELKNKGYSNVAIAEAMGVTEGSVRNWLKPGADEKAKQTLAISDAFRDAVDAKGIIDVGGGVENYLGVSKTRMDACVEVLKEEGYNVYYTKVKQAGTGKDTTIKALCPPDMTYAEFKEAYAKDPSIVKPVGFYAEERNGQIQQVQKPISISRDRIYVRYGDEVGPDGATGSDRDGVIQLRPGVEDLDLIGTRYAQVRIGVDDKMYMKGMAIYSDDIPDGYDAVYNVNKTKGSPDDKVFKPMYKKGEDDPFGASTYLKDVDEETGDIIYQKSYTGKDGKKHLSALNIVNDQGSWDDWSPSIASQMLSKQSPDLAKKQLGIVSKSKEDELKEILALTNPTVRKKMLNEFAETCDSAAVHLKAAALPRQKTQVLIPIPSLKDTEIYAPNFRDGETVVLVRYPHAGPFESPQLIVNNKNKEGISVLGKSSTGKRALDAVGINARVAAQLSGADFDGDSVLVIPNNDGKIKTRGYLEGLRNFDPKISYKLPDSDPINSLPPGSKELKTLEARRERNKQNEMGRVSNLITDMTIKGATDDELVRAVKHSMVVIDSVKHKLDVKQSYIDNNIQGLKEKYQAKDDPTKPAGGSSTLISRAKGEKHIPERKPVYSTKQMSAEDEKRYYELKKTDPVAAAKMSGLTKAEKEAYDRGEVIYRETGRTKIVKTSEGWVDSGKLATQTTTNMAYAKDAHALSSGSPIEKVYADHANKLKSLANQARAASRTTPNLTQSSSAKETYKTEVASLKNKLTQAEMNRPVERQAQLIARASLQAKVVSNPELKEDRDSYKKAENKALTMARTMVGAKKQLVDITDREWEAIQAGAISNNMLTSILNNTDMDAVKKRATPRASTGLSLTQIARAKAMASNGLSQAEIADALGVSTSTINTALNA